MLSEKKRIQLGEVFNLITYVNQIIWAQKIDNWFNLIMKLKNKRDENEIKNVLIQLNEILLQMKRNLLKLKILKEKLDKLLRMNLRNRKQDPSK